MRVNNRTAQSALPGIARQMGIPDLKANHRMWADKTAVVIGNGTSLIGKDLTFLRRPDLVTMIANSGVFMCPWADVLMCSDRHWLAEFSGDLSMFVGGTIVVTRPEAVVKIDPRMRYARRAFIEHVQGDIFANPNVLVEGHTSTATNISLAVIGGAKRIVLLGIDLSPGKDGRRRAIGATADKTDLAPARYAKQARHLTMQSRHVLQRGIKVINCSPPSQLNCYEYADWGAI
jgi:hypothetical protein